MELADTQLQTWLQGALWPLVRITAVMMSAPVFGERYAPARIRLGLSLALLVVLLPVLPPRPVLPAFGAQWWLAGIGEMVFGLAIGFSLRLVFEAMVLAGELISLGMGLGFARMADPVRGTDSPVVGSFMRVLAMLLFLALGGHLRLISALADSFTVAPVGAALLQASMFKTLALLGSVIFAGGVAIALPIAAAMLIVNLGFGVMNRSAPTLNATSVGFPISLFAGLVLLGAALVPMLSRFSALLDEAWLRLDALIHAMAAATPAVH